ETAAHAQATRMLHASSPAGKARPLAWVGRANPCGDHHSRSRFAPGLAARLPQGGPRSLHTEICADSGYRGAAGESCGIGPVRSAAQWRPVYSSTVRTTTQSLPDAPLL